MCRLKTTGAGFITRVVTDATSARKVLQSCVADGPDNCKFDLSSIEGWSLAANCLSLHVAGSLQCSCVQTPSSTASLGSRRYCSPVRSYAWQVYPGPVLVSRAVVTTWLLLGREKSVLWGSVSGIAQKKFERSGDRWTRVLCVHRFKTVLTTQQLADTAAVTKFCGDMLEEGVLKMTLKLSCGDPAAVPGAPERKSEMKCSDELFKSLCQNMKGVTCGCNNSLLLFPCHNRFQ